MSWVRKQRPCEAQLDQLNNALAQYKVRGRPYGRRGVFGVGWRFGFAGVFGLAAAPGVVAVRPERVSAIRLSTPPGCATVTLIAR